MAKLFYDTSLIHGIEQRTRNEFAAHGRNFPEHDTIGKSYARMGKVIGPAFMRALCEESNLNTPTITTHQATSRMVAWMLVKAIAESGATAEEMEAHLMGQCTDILNRAVGALVAVKKPAEEKKGGGERSPVIEGNG